MRRRTAVALGGLLAATSLAGTVGTMATFSDTTSFSVEAGAGWLDLDVTAGAVEPLQVREPSPGREPATVRVRTGMPGGTPAELRLSVPAAEGQDPCAGLPGLLLTVQVPGAQTVRTDLCEMATEPGGVLLLRTDAPAADLVLSLTSGSPAGSTPAVDRWAGALRFVLAHDGGGFRDEHDVPVHVLAPDAQRAGGGQGAGSGTGGGGNGRTPGSGTDAGTAGD
ncbi:MAG TPA: hypothetical protein VHF92_11080 [Geodermatophilus sp.]|nr:hypothetical protein [Geodermatophilus sp.]